MSKIDDIFAGRALNREEFEASLADAGLVLLDNVEGGYVPSSRERELTSEMTSQRERFECELKKVRAEGILRETLIRSGAHNPTLASRAIDMETVDGDEAAMLSAAEAKVASLKASDPYMFRDSVGEVISTGAYHGTASTDPDMMSDSEYYRHIRMK